MNSDDFNKVLQIRIEQIRNVLMAKAKEYARNDDRLRNFKRAGAMQNITPEEALIGMFAKHMVSIMDLVDDLGHGQHSHTEIWNEKLGDAINYMILLEGLITERYNSNIYKDTQSEDNLKYSTLGVGQPAAVISNYPTVSAPGKRYMS